jgi:hypothetical protein
MYTYLYSVFIKNPFTYLASVAELNLFYHFLALLRAHPILHVSRVRVKYSRPIKTSTKN